MRVQFSPLYILLILVINSLTTKAQNYVNVLNGRYYYLPSATLKENNQSVKFSEYRIETALPIELKGGNLIGLKPQYKTFSLRSENDTLKDLRLHTFKLPLFTYLNLGESGWSVYIDISPKLNSDLKNVSNRHFQIGGMFLFFKERNENFFWQFGMFYNQDTYGPFFMPLFGIDWVISEKDYFAALLPAYIIYERKISSKFYAGFELELSGETFRLGGSIYENSYISQLGENKLTFMTEPRLFIDYYVIPHLVIYLRTGMRLFHMYEHYTVEDERVQVHEYVEGKLKENFYLEAGLALRFRYDEE